LRRWSDQQDAYHRALLAFASNYGDCANDLARLVAADDQAATRALSHKIRGLAANLGLTQLAGELGLLEQAIADEDAATVAAMLADMQAHAARALGAIEAQTAPAGVGAGGAVPTPLDAGSLERLGATLMQSLQRGAIDDAALKQMTNALARHPDSARIADLWKAIDNFDFDVAQAALAALLADITRKPGTAQ
jgi:HPt (histidine-containing phosphotransfer) domain-containing protein